MIPLKRSYHPSWIVAVSASAPLLLTIGVIGWLVAPTPAAAYVNTVLVIAFCSIGWTIGMMLSPDSTVEEKKFSGIWKGVSLFVSGYLVSKIDPLIAAVLKPESLTSLEDPLIAFRVAACVATILLTAIMTYVLRVYAFTVINEARITPPA